MTNTRAQRTPARPSQGEAVGARQADGRCHVDAGSPWYLDAEDQAWCVAEGRVDVFAVHQESGRRVFAGCVSPGQSLGRRHVSPDGQWQVIAIGIPGTVIEALHEFDLNDAPDMWMANAQQALAEQTSENEKRFRHLAMQDKSELLTAQRRLAGVGLARTLPTETDDDALAACAALAVAEGFAPPSDIRPDAGPVFDRIQQAAATIPARARAVNLEPDWWLTRGDGFITQDSDNHVVAVLPHRRATPPYRIFRNTSFEPLTADQAAELSSDAIVLQPVTSAPATGLVGLLKATRQQVRAEFLWMSVLALASALVGLLVPLTLGAVVNAAVPNRSSDQVIGLVSLLVAASIAAFVFDLVRNLAVLRVGGELDRAVLPAVWDRFLRLPVAFFRKYDVGDLLARIPALDGARTSATDAVVVGGVSIVLAVVNLGLIAFVVPTLFLVTLALLLIVAVIVWVALRGAFAAQRRALEFSSARDAMGLQLIRGVAKIRVAGATATMFARWIRLLTSTSEQQQIQSLRIGFVGVATSSLALIGSGLAYTITIIGGDAIPIGSFVIFASALTVAVGAVASLSTLFATLGFARTMAERIRPVLATETEDRVAGARVDLDGSMSFQDVHFAYGDVPVLDGFTLDVPAGSFTALVGASGCGKSTVLRCLLGFETPERGSIFLMDRPLQDMDLTYVRRQFGVVPQRLTVLGGSLLDNIVGSRALTEDDAWQAAEKVGLAEFIQGLPMKMQTVIVDGGSTLSGGQLQRLMLARAVAGNLKILVLDEATSALDNPTQQLVMDSLSALPATRLVVAHRLSTVMAADQIAVMDAGRVVELGNHHELLATGGRYVELIRRQL
jgi:ABC-type bacteriocin/lantibiotic exporter with double-glycine peptidase domain